MPVQDNETKAGIFPGKVIIVDHGKVAKLRVWAHFLFCEGVGVRFPALLDSVILLGYPQKTNLARW